jgi:hypothetical protein
MKMKSEFKRMCLLTIAFGLCSGVAFGHKEVVHRKITENAADSALSLSTAYSVFQTTVSSDISIPDAKQYMSDGSFHEDDFYKDEGGFRSINHFYDPLSGQGLSNIPIDDRMSPFGVDSFTWGSQFDCPGINFRIVGIGVNINTYNKWSWQNARSNEWVGLTATNKADRVVALTDMFRDLGRVMHLLEDTTSPQHVRNEQHLAGSPIEDYGSEHLLQLNYQHGDLTPKAGHLISRVPPLV